jgi:hypothetical protein
MYTYNLLNRAQFINNYYVDFVIIGKIYFLKMKTFADAIVLLNSYSYNPEIWDALF